MKAPYFALADEEIDKRQEEMVRRNKAMIEAFNKLPFWKRWFCEDDLKQEIMLNYKRFEVWMNQRIVEQRAAR